MTKEEGINLLLNYCDAKIDATGWVRLKDPDLRYKTTRLLEDHEKTVNLSLPEKLEIRGLTIDKNGITDGDLFNFEWKHICASAIKIQIIYYRKNNYIQRLDHYLLLCLMSGEVKQFFLGDLEHLHGLTGHFIEQYKLQYIADAGQK